MATVENRLANEFNVATYFVDRNVEEGRGNEVAIFYNDQQLTYSQVLDGVNRTGHVLAQHGRGRWNFLRYPVYSSFLGHKSPHRFGSRMAEPLGKL